MPRTQAPAPPANLKDLPRWLEGCAGFAPLVDSLRSGQAGTVDGAWNSSAALLAAALAQAHEAPVLVVISHPREIDPWAEDLAGFSGCPVAVFPAWDKLPDDEVKVDDIGGRRLRLLRQVHDAPPRLILTTMQALLQPVPTRDQVTASLFRLRIGQEIPLSDLLAWLVDHGFQNMEAVELPGEFSRRGGILDVFSPDAVAPYRLEFLGDEIESIRQFAVDTQRSLRDLQAIEITTAPVPEETRTLSGHLCDWLPENTWTVLVEPEELDEQGKLALDRTADPVGLFSVPAVMAKLTRFPSVCVSGLPRPSVETTFHLRAESVERFSGDVTRVQAELDAAAASDFVLVACHNEAEKKRLGDVLAAGELARQGRLALTVGLVRAGFRLVLDAPPTPVPEKPKRKSRKAAEEKADEEPGPEAAPAADRRTVSRKRAAPQVTGIVVLGDHELFLRDQATLPVPRRQIESRAIDSFLDLREDDLVVHLAHGIARFRGLATLEKNGQTEEHLILEFAGGTRVYVPATKIELVQKYVGGSKTDPELSKLGGTGWQKRKEKVEAAVFDLASDMVELQAQREAKPGFPFPQDSDWQGEFEAAFPYQETPDQLTTLGEIKKDMQRPRSMDRLICGDVGYGKTELAIRAAFKAIDNGKQVAVLVPTTVLAEQHFRTFSQRLAEYPFVVEVLSRFRSGGEQKRIIERLGKGGIDVVIGTHRLVSDDVRFQDLGLAIIDEEQRFGVEHKEKLKKLRQTVDVLTMTATPIPRTLHLSLLGIRDISNLETPPAGRLAIETRIVRFDPQMVRQAILRELNREGQVYFVHNRVFSIHQTAERLRQIVPEARIVVGHGQMSPDELEDAMVRFVQRQADILVATTIIESGLDIPNANTIFIDQADHYGLADLHQLRGRVGRYKHRAYCYLLLDPDRPITPNAGRRLKAIEEFRELGAGFKIALRDLEIRGAGNILGTQQSGHIAAVGYELYCQLLENAVRRTKNLPLRTPLETTVELPWPAFLPRDYVPGQKQKIEVYRRLSRLRKLERLEDFAQELGDRFGPLPEAVVWLLRATELRLLAANWQIASVHLEGKGLKELEERDGSPGPLPLEEVRGTVDVVFHFRQRKKIAELERRTEGRLRVVNQQEAYFRLRGEELPAASLYECLKHLLRPAAGKL